MKQEHRQSILALLVTGICIGLLWWSFPNVDGVAAGDTLEAGGELQWHKGNIHTHSHWSDGDDYLENIGLWYRDHDYQFLCFTDHNVLANTERWIDVGKSKGGQKAYDRLKKQFPDDWVVERTNKGRLEVKLKTFAEVSEKLAEPGKYLLIQGEEISDSFGRYPIHLNASNVQTAIPPMKGGSVYETIQNNVNAVIAQRERTKKPIMVHLNHPNFRYAITAEDLMRVRGERFFEVYNGHPGVHNSGDKLHASTERMWDIILAFRLKKLGLPMMFGIATDDGHNYFRGDSPGLGSQPGRGWVMVLASKLDPHALIPAMEQGKFYASSGVSLKSVTPSKKGLALEIEPDEGVTYKIEFIGTEAEFNQESKPVLDADGNEVYTTRKYSDEIGKVLKTVTGTKADYQFTGQELYVRAKITSTRKHPNPSEPNDFECAWVQPVRGPGAPVEE